MNLVTGGSGFFGQAVVEKLLARGETVRVFDLNPSAVSHPNLEVVIGDIRDRAAVARASEGVTTVFHNVAQVPLAKDIAAFWSVNRDGMTAVLDAALGAGVQRVVYTSSSAVFGIPKSNPVTEETPPSPGEDYGAAKLAGEVLCREYAERGLDYAIIRPRTIMGHGRLGIFQILFEWIHQGRNLPVLGPGDNLYQFVHADDLADACILARGAPPRAVYNIGAKEILTMRETLEGVVRHAGSLSKVKSVPKGLATAGMRLANSVGLSPLGPYHALMYGESLYFDISKAERELGYAPRYSQSEMFAASYDWYVSHRDDILAGRLAGSKHQSAVRQGVLAIVPYLI